MKLTYMDWEQYARELKNHELHMQAKEPVKENFENPTDYLRARSEWEKELAMCSPNKPGYYRANND